MYSRFNRCQAAMELNVRSDRLWVSCFRQCYNLAGEGFALFGVVEAESTLLGQPLVPGAVTARNAAPLRFLTKDEFAALPETGTIDPMRIRFSQDSIKGHFQQGGTVRGLAGDLESGAIEAESIPPIRIGEKNGQVYTLDNRRLKAFQEARVPIRYQKLESIPKREEFKFTTRNQGVEIQIRGE